MYLLNVLSNPVSGIIVLLSIVIAVTVHEFAHAKSADMLGDPTAEAMGRVTLDPRAHLDLMGSLLFLLIGFGWGKPVPFDPYNLDNPKRDAAIIAFAGPGSNVIMACLASVVLYALSATQPALTVSSNITTLSLFYFIQINIALALFNMVPIAPLDGFKIVGGFLSDEQAAQWYSLQKYGLIFLLLLIFPFAGGKSMIEMYMIPVLEFITSILVPLPLI